MKIIAPGVYRTDFATYLADDFGPKPTLNASTAGILLNRSPRHAWTQHPRLNPAYQSADASHFDKGSAAHALLLEGEEIVTVIDAPDWRTKAAKEARAECYANGQTPLLSHQYEEVKAMVDAAKAQLAAHKEIRPFSEGQAEQTCIFEIDEVLCRCRPDWLADDKLDIADYKTTTNSHPDAFARAIYNYGYDISEAFSRLAIKQIFSIDARFRFIAQETEAPYALSVIELTPAAKAMGEAKVYRALDLWRQCLESNAWPGYPARTAFVSAPVYEEIRWEETKERDMAAVENGEKLLETMLHWQAPLTNGAKDVISN